MKIPNKIKICGYDYQVILEPRGEKSGVTAFASSNAQYQKIWIRSNTHPDQQLSSLLHEVIEQINDLNDLKLDHSQISTLEVGFFQFLKDNELLKEE